MPDELNWLNRTAETVRPLVVGQTESLPLYVQDYGASIRKRGDTLEVWVDKEKRSTARLIEVSQVAIFGSAYLSTPTIAALMERDIPITWSSYGGWFYGHAHGLGHKNAQLREAQYRASFDQETCLQLSRWLVAAKIQNGRTLLRRNGPRDGQLETILKDLRTYRQQALRAGNLASLLGIEGVAAQRYFQALPLCFKSKDKVGRRV